MTFDEKHYNQNYNHHTALQKKDEIHNDEYDHFL